MRSLVLVLLVFAAACGGGDGAADSGEVPSSTTTTSVADTAPPDTAPPDTAALDTARPGTADGDAEGTASELPQEIGFLGDVWPTNWAMRTVELDELHVGIGARDPRDLIRPIDAPVYEDVATADEWLEDRELGILLEVGESATFFPVRILIAHEIVNDQRGDVPFSVTYCPLCNTAVAFDRRLDGEVLRLGVSGLLRHSDLVMWDDLTVSLWQQTTGEAIVGDLAGSRLTVIPSALVTWADFRSEHVGGDVLSQDSGPFAPYGSNAYTGYTSRSAPFPSFFRLELDERHPALSRVVGVRIEGDAKAYPFSVIAAEGAVDDVVGGMPITVWWGAPDTADPLDGFSVADGAPIGTGIAFERTVDGQELTFAANGDDTFTDAETGSTWTLLGVAVGGPLEGSELPIAIHQNEFWFAWAAFNQGSPVYGE
jgi:hypothetical protein